MSFCGIYQIKNTVNGKKYIGQSINIERRLKQHLRELRGGHHVNKHLMNAFNKYGEENFEASIIAICDKKDLDVFEQWFINIQGCVNPKYGYNKTYGDGQEGFKHSAETKIKISKNKNSSGYRNVSRDKKEWRFSYYEKGELKSINSYILSELKSKVEKKGFRLEIIDEENAKKSRELDDKKKFKHVKNNSTGFLRVSEHNKSAWVYECMINGKRTRIYKKTLKELEYEVKKKGLPWKVIDREKAKLSQQKDLNKAPTRYRKNKTGIYKVSKEKRCWRYTYKDKNGNIHRINSSSLVNLKKKVLEKEEKWIVVEKDKLEKICEKYKYIMRDLL